MKALTRLLRMTRADVLERTRSFGFFVVLAASVYAGNAFLPPNHSTYATFRLDQHRGLYNSAWVGTLEALLTGVFLSLVGFYLVKNAVERDRQTRVGEILASCTIGRVQYTVGKTLSNFAVLASMAAVVAISAGVTQMVRGENTRIEAWPLIAPFLFLTLPVLLYTSALAVFFEATPGLRGGLGNVVYFFLFPAVFALSLGGEFASTTPHNDLIGAGMVMPSIVAACKSAFPGADLASSSMGINFKSEGVWSLTTFEWRGIAWTPVTMAPRLFWVAIAMLIATAAALPFDRFDPARAGWIRSRKRDGAEPDAPAGAGAVTTPAAAAPTHLSPLTEGARAGPVLGRFAACVIAEAKLALRGQNRWWYLGWLVLAGLAIGLPLETARGRMLPLLWVWPMLVWSPFGTRERRHGTDAILFSAPHPLALQFAAQWTAGVLITMAAAAPVAIRLAATGDFASLLGWAVGAAFIPAMALALGAWTGTSRTFEATYIALWYVGPLQPVPPLDFTGASRAAIEGGTPATFAVVTAALLAAAALGRRRQLLG